MGSPGLVEWIPNVLFATARPPHKHSKASAPPLVSIKTSQTDAWREGTNAWWISSLAA